MKKRYTIFHVVGARPQFVKVALVNDAARTFKSVRTRIIHTGQHYDRAMSDVFFDQLDIPRPAHNLGIGSGTHGEQTAAMLAGLERIFAEERPDMVFVYGDTNSTLAGALAASKLGIPLAHVEAGLRSFVRSMPEEINRVMTDHVADILFCPTKAAVANLAREGARKNVFYVRDTMIDMIRRYGAVARKRSTILHRLALVRCRYYLATVHRSYNTDAPERLAALFEALGSLGAQVILPLHPRTRKMLISCGIKIGPRITVIDPVSYIDMLMLEMNAALILTDSGGIQKEAYFLRVPCITLREETEWVETVKSGWNVLVGVDKRKIIMAERRALKRKRLPDSGDVYGRGASSREMISIALSYLSHRRKK